ncbi:MAG TPA: DUF2167 domain-containing protein [Rudaea sp.]|jgi:uncharacterized membrane-anchored protein|nr:DUF2167 domain-containing protein [Rudaea sp.]
MIASIRRLAACAMLPFAVSAFADEHSKELQQFLDSLHYRTGTVEVKGGHATLKLTNDFRYLDAGDAQRVLELWGNPPDKSVLGLIEPANVSPVERNGWAVVITYSDDGHVADTDAAKIDYSKMLKDMQDQTRDSNEERKKSGYESVDLVGWATPPHYDAASNKLYWAKDLAFAGQSEHTLNYDIRVLGRGGYLSLNAVANMSQLPLIESKMQNVLAMTDFDAGQRYGDFNASTDKLAAYGIGALVAGTIAAKAGLFTKLFIMILAAKKFIIAGLLAVGAAFKKFFGRSKS